MTSPREATEHLRVAREILGTSASAVEVILAAEFIRQGYLDSKIVPAVMAIGVERAKNPQPDETTVEPDHPHVHSFGDTHIGFASENPAWEQ